MVYRPLSTRYGTAMAVSDRLRSLAREQTEQALNVIIGIMNAATTSDRDKLTAAFGLLDRGWGKPTQLIEAQGARETMTRKLTYEVVHVNETQEAIDNEDLVVDFHEIKNGNGRDRTS
jgi:ATP:corrinoid adenosyltransferase